MADNNGNGRWQIAFWIISVLVIGSYTLTWGMGMKLADAIVCNDRLRQVADNEVKDKLELYQRDIIQRLSRIEAKIEK
ncbi:MAG: hypothetical protein WC479_09915 [Candidatus Izemoplasmatales bacterium]